MYNFTRSDWSIEATDRKRERLRRISDEELLREMESAHRMCSAFDRKFRRVDSL